MKKWRPESVLDLYNLLLAAFLFGSPWLFGYVNGNARMDAWATGALIALISVGALIAFADWEEWLNLFLGVWLILAPWILGFAHTRPTHVIIPIGALVAFLAALQLWMEHYDKPSLDRNRFSGDH
jgi:hypothetical protein